MKKTGQELIEFCRSKLGTPYVFGMKGQVLTEPRLQSLIRECPSIYTPRYIEKAGRFMGRACTDCSGLISWCTGILRGSGDYRDSAVEIRPISELNETMQGWALWKKGHIGVYIGNGKCIEAKGIDYGTVETKVGNTAWVKILKLKDIAYAEQNRMPKAEAAAPKQNETAPQRQNEAAAQRQNETAAPKQKQGWTEEENGLRFYLDPERCVRNDWYRDGGKWYWFDGAGHAICDNWYLYKDNWYYFGADHAMKTGLQIIKGKPYYFRETGEMEKTGGTVTFRVGADGQLSAE